MMLNIYSEAANMGSDRLASKPESINTRGGWLETGDREKSPKWHKILNKLFYKSIKVTQLSY